MTSKSITEFAPAKVNLTLHVTGQRADGYHLLDSLVVFCGVGDRLDVSTADATALSIKGPFAKEIPSGADNLVMRAAAAFAEDLAISLQLEKILPPASGVGGGSADAAAAIRAILRLRDQGGQHLDPLWRSTNIAKVSALGADVPVCLSAEPSRMRGVGERVERIVGLPEIAVVLVNPRIPVATSDVFRSLSLKQGAPMPQAFPRWRDAADLARWLHIQRNDLELPARGVAPVIGDVLGTLIAQPEVLIARMSGSGATCFGLFATLAAARRAATSIGAARPSWWAAAGPVLAD